MRGKEKCVIEKHSKCKQLARQNICTRQEREYVRKRRSMCSQSVFFSFFEKEALLGEVYACFILFVFCVCHAGSIIFMH